ncbi:MAG: 23S rRNA (pseudouridine(1915)-N(3))-methyltransferase RlmH [Bacteriovoracales bacterium]
MREVFLLCPFKVKDKNILSLESEYLKRITEIDFKIIEVKDKELIPEKIADLGKASVILLEEKGLEFNSQDFSSYFENQINISPKIIFVMGGADGHASETIQLKTGSLSLSQLTFPHQLARVLFIEQVYRAFSILKKHPYHK